MPFVARNADDQLGRLIDTLKANDQFDETLILVTADHGGQDSVNGYYGTDVYDGGNVGGWYAGQWFPQSDLVNYPPTVPNTSAGPAALAPLMATGNVDFSYQSTAIESWLKDDSAAKKAQAADIMGTLPGVVATYKKSADSTRYVLHSARTRTRMNPSELAWWQLHGQELVNTMAFEGSADVVGLLKDRVSYGVFGDHGGAQKQVQRIPMIVYNPSIPSFVNGSAMRTVDIMPTVLRTMGIPLTAPADGRAYKLPVLP